MAVRLQKPQSLPPLIDSFVFAKQNNRCSPATAKDYRWWLEQLAGLAPDSEALNSAAFARFFAGLRERGLKPSSQSKAFRVIGTFVRWCAKKGYVRRSAVDALDDDDLRPRVDRTLPDVPTEEEVAAILRACQSGLNGRRNYAMVCVMADAGLRSAEVRRLLVGHWNREERKLFVKAGKGSKDRVAFVTPKTARAIKDYLEMRPGEVGDEDFLFSGHQSRPVRVLTGRTRTLRDGRTVQVRELRRRPSRPMGPRHLVAILHRLSRRAGLREDRRMHPHLLRHYAATSWARKGMPPDAIRRLLGHVSMNTTTIYLNLVGKDLREAHERASAFEDIAD